MWRNAARWSFNGDNTRSERNGDGQRHAFADEVFCFNAFTACSAIASSYAHWFQFEAFEKGNGVRFWGMPGTISSIHDYTFSFNKARFPSIGIRVKKQMSNHHLYGANLYYMHHGKIK